MKNTMKKPVNIPVSKLRPFEGHPFKVKDDAEMNTLIESIQTQGVLTPLIVRPVENTDEYEVISGHRRLHAAKKARIVEIPALIYALDRDSAAIAVVDSNLHREHILPSEKAFAYKMKADAMNHKGWKTDLTSGQVVPKSDDNRTTAQIGADTGDSYKTVQRYIRLTNLIPEILQYVDDGRIAFTPAVELSYGSKILIKVKDEVKLVIDATPGYEPYDRQKIIDQNKKNAVRHAYFREYLALQRLCLLILRHQKHQIGSGSKQIYGILFDGAWLWEEYVHSLIEDIFYHPMNKGGKGAQRLFEGNIGLIYPDFISRDNEARIIADAKYKPIDNIGNRDYLQVLAYMFRFDAKAGFYLYPEAEGLDDLKLRMNQGSTYESNVMPRDDISITKHGLKIPTDAADYDGFVARMKINEKEFVRTFT